MIRLKQLWKPFSGMFPHSNLRYHAGIDTLHMLLTGKSILVQFIQLIDIFSCMQQHVHHAASPYWQIDFDTDQYRPCRWEKVSSSNFHLKSFQENIAHRTEKENAELKEKNRQLKNEVDDLSAYCNQIGKIKTDVLKLFEHIVAR